MPLPLCRRVPKEFVDPRGTFALYDCCFVPLDKKPGVRLIGVCEMLRQILGKAVPSVAKKHVQSVTGALQLCAGQVSGCEAAILPCDRSIMIRICREFFLLTPPMPLTV